MNDIKKTADTSNVPGAIFAAGIALLSFGSVYKPEILGVLASSPGSLILIFMAVFSMVFVTPSQTAKYGYFLVIWGFLISFASLWQLGFDSLYYRKFFTIGILALVWLSPILCIDVIRLRSLFFGVASGIAILMAGFLISDLWGMLPASVYNLVFGGTSAIYLDARPRSFMSETSHFSGLLGRYAFCLLLLYEIGRKFSAARLFAALGVIGGVLFYIEGKGAAIALLFAMGAAALNRKSLPYLLLIGPLAILIGAAQLDALGVDIERFTSTSTRSVLIAGGLLSVTSNPFGHGYYGFYQSIREFGGEAANVAAGFGVNLTEVDDIIYNFENVSSKSTLIDFVIIFGVPFLIFLFLLIRNIDLKDPRVLSALVFFLTLALSTSGNESIPFFLGLAILLKYYPSERLQRAAQWPIAQSRRSAPALTSR